VSPQDFVVQRVARADSADAAFGGLLDPAVTDVALVAVGGYGRRELSPYSDLDVVLVHADDVDPRPVAEQVWYPLWDAGVALDHSVRTIGEMRRAARADLRTALGLLDARHVAGDPSLTLQVRSLLLADWRRDARRRLPELATAGAERARRWGDLAYTAVPHLKESRGGLRDAVVLRCLVATWLVDVPHAEVERCRRELLGVRDALHHVAGRAGDRLLPELAPDVADLLGIQDLDRHVREYGRRIAYLSQLTWRRVEHALAAPGRARRPDLVTVAPGVAQQGGEVVLEAKARPDRDPLLLLRAAVAAAEHDLVLSPASAVRLARESALLPAPWTGEARRLLVRLLGSGPALAGVWETLEQAGAIELLLPEWAGVALRRSSSPAHTFTVDRHLVQTCVEASRLLHRVRRPDLLLLAALLHDIGKTGYGDHSERGAQMTRTIAGRWGFPATDCDTAASLVRLHLLLPHTATRRDLDDPATAGAVADAVQTTERLDLLAALTEADARATGPAAWTTWRARLVSQLLTRARAALEGTDPPLTSTPPIENAEHSRLAPREVMVRTERHPDGTVVEVGASDRLGLLSDVAASLALSGLEVLSARAATRDGQGWSRWLVSNSDIDPRRVRQRLQAVLDGALDPRSHLPPPPAARAEPAVTVHQDASASATVIEVRDRDWTGLVSAVCAALATAGVDVRSAHVETIGPRAVDVFYVTDGAGRTLSSELAATIGERVRTALRA
jgi:[protein-PII] uridylyltransferase